MDQNINKNLKDIQDASKVLRTSVRIKKTSKKILLGFFCVYSFVITFVLMTSVSGLMYFITGLLGCIALLTYPTIKEMDNERKELEVQVENADFLESFWKGALLEKEQNNGWEDSDGNV